MELFRNWGDGEDNYIPKCPEIGLCGDCEYWNKWGDRIFGDCTLSTQGKDMMSSKSGLETREDFGCTSFRQKKWVVPMYLK